MQIYNALPILTAQPGAEDLAIIPHVLYSALDVTERCSAQQWRDMARAEIEKCFAAQKRPVIVGGTGLYLKALMMGLSEVPPIDPQFRERGNALQRELGNPAFHAMLEKMDPVMAGRLNPNDTQRLIRAYEVFLGTGRSLGHWQDSPRMGPPDDWRFTVMIATPDRAELHRRCDMRFDTMMRTGAMEEIDALWRRIERGEIPADAPITHALGFTPLCGYLRGEMRLEDALFRAKAETRQYAKRQSTWFRNQMKPSPGIEEIRFVP